MADVERAETRIRHINGHLVPVAVKSEKAFVERYESPNEDVATLYDNFEASVRTFGRRPCLGTRLVGAEGEAGPYSWETYEEVARIRTEIGSGLIALGIRPGASVGIYGVNCREWMLADFACHAYAMVDVPLYDTLGVDAVEYIINHADIEVVFCSSAVLPTLMESIKTCPTLRAVVVYASWGTPEPPFIGVTSHFQTPIASLSYSSASNGLPGSGAHVLNMADLIQLGKMHPSPHAPPSANSVATICYTSGTTGTPKGVVLTHAMMIANSAATCRLVPLSSDDCSISYLPLAHIYERINSITAVHSGTSLGFYRGDVLQLLDDINELKPTVFSSVPRLWNRIYDKIQAQLQESSFVKRWAFQAAYSAGRSALRRGQDPPFWTRPIFNALKAKLGGRVRIMVTGASPLSPDIMEFLRICFGTVVEGYGMTETACVITLTDVSDTSTGHVGRAVPCCEVKLADIPEMNYRNSDKPLPRGEICVRGPSVFTTYYKSPEQTQDVLDGDGWLHTGDVGMWLPGGKLKIIDRKKNIFKLAQGEYVAPEKIENVYVKCPLVMQCMVYGDSLKDKLVAIIVVDPDALQSWANTKGRGKQDGEKAGPSDPRLASEILNSMRREGEAAGLKGFEQVHAIHVEVEPWTPESGLLTPTMKIKRSQLKERYQIEIDNMYRIL